jgi:uncharacterized protein YqeY
MNERIKKDMMIAMREKNTVARDILRVLRGEIQRNEQSKKGKLELSDADIIQIIKKMIDNMEHIGGEDDEIKVLEVYLPKQMTEEEITHKVKEVINDNDIENMRGMGVIMAHFKNKYDGTYDGRMLSVIVKTLLS